jgi:hypothetical protein
MAGERTQMGDENENDTGVVSAEYGACTHTVGELFVR